MMTRIPTLACLLIGLLLLGGCTRVQQVHLAPQRWKAQEAFENGDYLLAATRYESLSDRYPHSPEREEMLMHQGISLYTMGAYHDARRVFMGSLREFPEGRFAADARDYIKKIDILMADNSPAKVEALKQAEEDLDQLMALRRDHPNDPAVLMAIGNLYYEMGDYENAVRYYYESQQVSAAYQEKSLIQRRMRLDEDGKPVPVSPTEQEQAYVAENPLVVTNLNDYRARNQSEEFLSIKEAFFVVTGQVRNQGRELIQNVSVEVTFYNSLKEVLDIQVVRIGSLGPGVIRAFRAQASSYDNIYNIQSYEVKTLIE